MCILTMHYLNNELVIIEEANNQCDDNQKIYLHEWYFGWQVGALPGVPSDENIHMKHFRYNYQRIFYSFWKNGVHNMFFCEWSINANSR